MSERPGVAAIFGEVFGRPLSNEAFVSMDSLEATRLATALASRIGTDIPLRVVLDAPDAASLQRHLDGLPNGRDDSPTSRTDPREGDRRFGATLSFSQERMAFMQGLSTGSAAYHVAFGLRLQGRIDAAALSAAVAATLAAHVVFRLRFVAAAEGTVGVEQHREHPPLQLIDLQGTDASAPEAGLFAVASEFANAPFDLEHGITARTALILRDPRDGMLVLAFHHVVMDQWSYELLLAELAARYNDIVDGRALQPADDTSGYLDYIRWHRRWFRERGYETQLRYWRSRLDGSSRTTYPPDRGRPEVLTFRGARVRLEIGQSFWLTLEEQARAQGATLSMLLFSTLCLSLRNHSGNADLTAGLVIANRNHEGAGQFMGSLVNTLALRTQVRPGMPFPELLASTRQLFMEAFEHQDMPFDLLVHSLQLERSASLSPLFGVLLNVLNTSPADSGMKGLEVRRVEVDRRASQFDMTLTVDRLHTGSIWFEYSTDLYTEGTVRRIADRFGALLRAIASDIGQSVDDLPGVSEAETSLLAEWSRGPPALPPESTLTGLLLSGLARNPDATAVVAGESRLTYGDLHREALCFASGLAAAGIEPGDRVGLMLGRSVRLPVAILGTLLRGAAFVPLDPDFPEARLQLMTGDSRPGVVVVDDTTGSRAAFTASARITSLADLLDTQASAAAAPARIAADSPAYVLYTSGSSGTPKGVVVPRAALANLLFSMRTQPGLVASDRLLAITTFSFDIALLELLLPMVCGAQLVIASREQALDGHSLAQLIRDRDITVLQGTPSTWYQLLESGWQGRQGFRALVGGERLPQELAARLRPRVAELWNMYGPTETTIWSTCTRIEPHDGDAITVGRPIAGTRIAVADAWERAAGIGVPGEILIGGAGVALGYLGRQDLTAERFRTFPRIAADGVFYRTGDIGRWTEKGELECLGRTDSQVKVRGYRIEPGEIESVAATVEGVSRAIVVTSMPSEQDVRLLLCLQVAGSETQIVAAVREELRSRLPEYMIPGAIVVVREIPLLPNGKTDYARLAAAAGSTAPAQIDEAPLSDHELALHGIWCALLQRPAVGRHENFFELGGHSLLAMRLVTRIREDLLLHCTLSQVFRNPTIARLGAALQQTSPHTDQSLVPLRLEGSSPPLFCICGVQLYRPLAAHLADRGPLFAAYVPSQSGSIEDLAAQYLAMLREQQPAGPYRLMGFSLGGVIAYELAQRLADAGETVSDLIILDSDAPGMALADRLRNLLSPRRDKPGAPDEERFLQPIRRYRAKRYAGRAVFVEATATDHGSCGDRWHRLIPDLVRLRLHSDHLSMMSDPKVAELANLLRPHLR